LDEEVDDLDDEIDEVLVDDDIENNNKKSK
jgi:hypothetical protein